MKVWQIGAGLAAIGGITAGVYYAVKKSTSGGGGATGAAITIAAGPNGTTQPKPGTYTVPANISFLVTAMPDTGYKFDKWTGDVPAGQNPNSSLIEITPSSVQQKFALQANFVANPTPAKYTITFVAGQGGSISPSGTFQYDENSFVTVTATPNSGYKFVSFSGDWYDTNNPSQIKVFRDNMTVKANFSPVAQNGVQLQAGWNNGIPYEGTPGTCDQIFASLISPVFYLSDPSKPIWIYRPSTGIMYYWHPDAAPGVNTPPPNNMVLDGDLCYIYVTQGCFWSWI